MKGKILILLFVVIASLSIKAATKYEINVGGVEVTSDNAHNVIGGDITSGTVTYDNSTKTLTLTNVTITRTGGSNYGIHNRDCAGLTMKFVGTCNVSSNTANALHLDKETTVEITSGSTLNAKMTAGENYGRGVIYINGARTTFKGPGSLNVSGKMKDGGSQSNCATCGIEGTGKTSNSLLLLDGGINIDMNVTCHGIYKIKVLYFFDQDPVHNPEHLKIHFNYGFRAIYDTGAIGLGGVRCVTPADATFNESTGSFGGNDYYTHFTNDYGEIITTEKFPDANFRSSLRSLVSPEEYFTKAQL
ncbi:MAG: hypothetical protein J6S96_07805, partial [Muribaculaceae bacterium]|nr:hypothetical protein [Muribaculaceae bacterium]